MKFLKFTLMGEWKNDLMYIKHSVEVEMDKLLRLLTILNTLSCRRNKGTKPDKMGCSLCTQFR